MDRPRHARELAPHPCRALVRPGGVIVVLPPRAFDELDTLGRRLAPQVLRDTEWRRTARRELAQDVAEPVDPFEPPVPEQLAVERDREEGIAAALFAVSRERVAHETDEMHRMRPHALGRGTGRIGLLRAKARLLVRDAPIAKPAAVVLAMELAIRGLARITHHRRPHLSRDLVVPRDRDD